MESCAVYMHHFWKFRKHLMPNSRVIQMDSNLKWQSNWKSFTSKESWQFPNTWVTATFDYARRISSVYFYANDENGMIRTATCKNSNLVIFKVKTVIRMEQVSGLIVSNSSVDVGFVMFNQNAFPFHWHHWGHTGCKIMLTINQTDIFHIQSGCILVTNVHHPINFHLIRSSLL